MTEHGDADDALLDSNWFKYLVVAALVSSGGSGAISLTKQTDDRFRGADFEREIAERDREIAELRKWRIQHQREYSAHEAHSSKWTEVIKRTDESLRDHLKEGH